MSQAVYDRNKRRGTNPLGADLEWQDFKTDLWAPERGSKVGDEES